MNKSHAADAITTRNAYDATRIQGVSYDQLAWLLSRTLRGIREADAAGSARSAALWGNRYDVVQGEMTRRDVVAWQYPTDGECQYLVGPAEWFTPIAG